MKNYYYIVGDTFPGLLLLVPNSIKEFYIFVVLGSEQILKTFKVGNFFKVLFNYFNYFPIPFIQLKFKINSLIFFS